MNLRPIKKYKDEVDVDSMMQDAVNKIEEIEKIIKDIRDIEGTIYIENIFIFVDGFKRALHGLHASESQVYLKENLNLD